MAKDSGMPAKVGKSGGKGSSAGHKTIPAKTRSTKASMQKNPTGGVNAKPMVSGGRGSC